MAGPLSGVRIVELGGIGPVPYASMVLADAGADVLRITRPHAPAGLGTTGADLLLRSRTSIGVDLKRPGGPALVLDLVARADALVEGFRPGVAESLGLGPEQCLARNERLVYGRMTGWGQDGPMARAAGHDINYIAIAGALWPLGRAGERPVPPMNLIGDFGGGGMVLAFGGVAALIEAARSGKGQVVDSAMVDGAASLLTMMFSMRQMDAWEDRRGVNALDTGAPFYEVYETADGGYMAVGAIEPQFYAELVHGLGLEAADLPHQMDRSHWDETKTQFAAIFATKTRDEWTAVFADVDACVTPVLSPAEAPSHEHVAHRGTYLELGGMIQPGPVPRFDGTPGEAAPGIYAVGEAAEAKLEEWGIPGPVASSLHEDGTLA
jgi:alpha-methylacyl-CoA racemase